MRLNPAEIEAYRKKEEVNLNLIKRQIEKYKKTLVFVESTSATATQPQTARILNKVGIPVYPNPYRAARVLRHLVWYRQYLNDSL